VYDFFGVKVYGFSAIPLWGAKEEKMRKVIGILLVWSVAAVSMAQTCPTTISCLNAAPEINPAAAAAALTFLAGGLAVLRGRRVKK